jgi:hypothetical protein
LNMNFQIQSEVPEKMGHHLDLFQHDLTKRSRWFSIHTAYLLGNHLSKSPTFLAEIDYRECMRKDARNVNFGGKAPSVFSDIGSPQICHPVSLDKWSWRSREFRPDFPVASVAKMGSFPRKIPVDSCGFTFLLPGVPMASSHSTTADFHGAFL